MALYFTSDELREISLAIGAYRQALDQHNGKGAISETLRALESARSKILAEWETVDCEAHPRPRVKAMGGG
jgi:hypothetical protein